MFPFAGPMHQSNMGPPPGSIVPRYPIPVHFYQSQPSIQAEMPRVVTFDSNQQGVHLTNGSHSPTELKSI